MNASIDGATGHSRTKKTLKWVILIVGALFFILILREAIDPYGDQPYIEISPRKPCPLRTARSGPEGFYWQIPHAPTRTG